MLDRNLRKLVRLVRADMLVDVMMPAHSGRLGAGRLRGLHVVLAVGADAVLAEVAAIAGAAMTETANSAAKMVFNIFNSFKCPGDRKRRMARRTDQCRPL